MLRLTWQQAVDRAVHAESKRAISLLAHGYERFRSATPNATAYHQSELSSLASKPEPIAAVVACSDSRVAPELVFDQRLGALFVSRVPGNVASDGTKWMLEIAVTELRVPLILVLGHTGCLAVGQSLEGRIGRAGGTLRLDVQKAVHRAKLSGDADVYRRAVEENVLLTLENLRRESFDTQKAIEQGRLELLGAVYNMESGEVQLICP